MKIVQLSVFLENQPGRLAAPCTLLADAGINIVTLTLADTERFGILRLILGDWERAKDLLEQRGFVVKVTEVVAIEVEDRPGGLRRLLDALEKAGVNIEYMYAFTMRREDKAIMVMRLDEPDKGIDALQAAGIGVLRNIDPLTS